MDVKLCLLTQNQLFVKKTFITLVFAALFAGWGKAQVAEQAIGLRFGSVYGLGTEITYQRSLSAENRLQFDLGYSSDYEYANSFRQDYNSWAVTGIYQWVRKLNDGFNWYYGPGGRLGIWSNNLGYNYRYNNGLFLSAAGNIGIEYGFDSGIQLSLEARPEIGLVNRGSGVNFGFAVRYRFK